MRTQTQAQHPQGIRFEFINWVATPPLPRDREQSHRLHEPEHLTGTIDPMTGNDIGDLQGHPSLKDGNLTIYFESENTRQAYQRMPLNHPYEHTIGEPQADSDRGG